ncbi:sigma-70 family RNA polymerase sigma factor [Actinoallomurus liliacearum]|uniref:Sigma-70 family RNA polymerase sigma factor n=1 Tax=Actinoallomurus liliacearum TaxID=1080073 RepID=A0ABP8TXU4_9ACTN
MKSPSEDQRSRAGEREAFATIFDEHARVVYAHAVRMCGDPVAAEDVVSLTFLEAWRLRAKLRDEVVSVRLWLLGIATNVMRNTARAVRRHRAALSRMPPREPIPDFAEELVGRITDTELLAAAARALRRLRRGEREVVALCVWSGLGYAAAAEVLGVPVGTVRSRLSRARARLRELAADDLEHGRPDTQRPGRDLPEGRPSAARSFPGEETNR